MKKFVFVTLFSIFSVASFASHTKGGWMYYEYLGPGAAANTLKYRITLKLYTACVLTSGQFDPTINFSFFNGLGNQFLYNTAVTYSSSLDVQNCTSQECHPCINMIPSICYKITTYELVTELPKTAGGYTVSYQRCCRISGIMNIQAPSNNVGETWSVTIPGTIVAGAETNSSARFSQNDTAIICESSRFTFDFSATDPDNDSLVYYFTPAYAGGASGSPTPNPASNPPYASVPYAAGYSGAQPMGGAVAIDMTTGIVSGIAPNSGIYVLTVTVMEYRRGTNIKVSEVRKSLHIEVANCNAIDAVLKPDYISCDGFTVSFNNLNTNPNILTWLWYFGDGGTSTLEFPTHTYADTGIYTLKLVVNPGQQCSDSTTSIVKVYPGFFPDFTIAGQCKNTPIQFTDITTARYGSVNKWTWNFGEFSSPTNTSILQNPTHSYTNSGNYTVNFIVQSSKGCIDTVEKVVAILDKPSLTVTNDTLICYIDTLQLNAVGTGSFLWSPNYMISSLNINNPLVSPDLPTTYYVTLTDPFGCKATDSVKVDVKLFVTLFGGNDTTICKTDPVILQLNSDALHYLWTETPAGNTLNDPTLKNPTAKPLVTTTYHVVGNIGKCVASDDITITPIPYPPANAGPDQTICIGGSAQLNASGGSIYSWSPTAFLTAANIPNPVSVNPIDNVRYVVTVRDVLGCPKPVRDTMILYVAKIKADAGPRDTSVVLGQPLQLGASGSINYVWTPATWLNNPFISNPISLPQNDIEYVVRVSNAIGCFDTDSIRVKVFKLKPDLYVPTGFTPNGNGTNDILRPIAIGMRSVDLFRVYNRWGQMLYSGTGNGAGWDGTFGGKGQEAATYVWYAEGVDYLNNKIKRKGYVVLIR